MSVRHHLHILFAEVLYYSGSLAVWRFLRNLFLGNEQACILGFHRVLSEEDFSRSNSLPGMLMKEATFARLLEFIKTRSSVLSIGEMERASRHRPCYVVTFDDGWEDNYTTAFRWIKKYSVPVTIFLAAGFMGGENGFWVERLSSAWKSPPGRERLQKRVPVAGYDGRHPAGLHPGDYPQPAPSPASLECLIDHLKHMPSGERDCILQDILPANGGSSVDRMLSWDQVREMSRAGVEFGAHTVTHPLLPFEDDATLEHELHDAKLIIEQKLQKRVRAFAYPNGDWNAGIRKRVAAAGYDCAFTTEPGWRRPGQDPYTIHRILVHEGNVTGHTGKFSPAMFTLTTVRQ